MRRALVLAYGLLTYVLFFGTFVYSIGWIGDIGLPTSIDRGTATRSLAWAMAINVGLLSLFAIQHSGMARPAFKRWWTRIVPRPVERSTYVLFSVGVMWLLYWGWQPIDAVVWQVEAPAARIGLLGLYAAGWGLVLYSTILISHFDLFGLRQVMLYAQGRVYEHLPFDTPSLYGFVRHPLYVGWITVFWAAPTMTVGHLLFAVMCTGYILVAIQLEERDLVDHFGEDYRRYKAEVPMLVPTRVARRAGSEQATAA
jgi:protein-S-isoprenylcysteine O-methyltransferase Ste14